MADRTPWDDIQQLAESVGYIAGFELQRVEHPDLVCEPERLYLDDYEYPSEVVGTPMPDDMDEPTVCAVHTGEWWPCETFRERGGITRRPATVENVLVVAPKDVQR